MYNFKAIDYRLSKQEYVFSLLSSIDEDKYDFVYIPYAEFPALLMLDYILATSPHEFNADLFKYFQETGRLERCGSEDILIISEDLSNREGYVNKLGIFTKCSHLGQIQKLNNLSRKQPKVKGVVLKLGTEGGDQQKEISSLSPLEGSKMITQVDTNDLIISVKSNKTYSIIEYNIYPSQRVDETSIELLNVGTGTKGLIPLKIMPDIQAYRGDKNYGGIIKISNFKSMGRGAEFSLNMAVQRVNNYDAVNHDYVLAKTMNQFQGVTHGFDSYTRDCLTTSIQFMVGGGTREGSLKGSINDFTLAERCPYINSAGILDSINSSKGHEWSAYLNSINYANRYIEGAVNFSIDMVLDETPFESISILSLKRGYEWGGFVTSTMLPYKESNIDLINTIDSLRSGGGDGFVEKLKPFHKEFSDEVTLENIVISADDIERMTKLIIPRTFLRSFDNPVIMTDTNLFSINVSRGAIINDDGFALKDSVEKGIIEYIFYGMNEGTGSGVIYNIGVYQRDYDYKGELFSDIRGEGENDGLFISSYTFATKDEHIGYKDNYLVIANEGIERYADLSSFNVGDRGDGRDSIITFEFLADIQKEAYITQTNLMDKGKDIFLEYSSTSLRVTNLSAFLKFESDYIIERYGEGVLKNVMTPSKELSHGAVTDFSINYGGCEKNRYSYILSYDNAGSRSIGGGVYVEDTMNKGFNPQYRFGYKEFTLEAFKPRKKLIKSWLDGFERDSKKEMYLEVFTNADKCKSKDLIKYTSEISIRDDKKDLSIGDSLVGGEISRKNKLDKNTSRIDTSKPTSKNMSRVTELTHSLRDIKDPLLKFNVENFDYEKDGTIEYDEYFDKFKEAFIEEQVDSQSLMYDYSDILEEGMEVEHWKVGYAIPEYYDPLDPFNPYYPWAEERNTHSIIQEEEWEQTHGEWELDKGNAIIKAFEGGGILTTKKPYEDFKFKFNIRLGYEPDCRSGFVFNYIDIDNYYKVTLSPGNNPIDLIQVIGGRERKVATPIAPYYMDGGSWHNIDVSYTDNKLVVYVDGRLQYDLVLEY